MAAAALANTPLSIFKALPILAGQPFCTLGLAHRLTHGPNAGEFDFRTLVEVDDDVRNVELLQHRQVVGEAVELPFRRISRSGRVVSRRSKSKL